MGKFICRRCSRELDTSRLAEPFRDRGVGYCIECHKERDIVSWGTRGGLFGGEEKVDDFTWDDISLGTTETPSSSGQSSAEGSSNGSDSGGPDGEYLEWDGEKVYDFIEREDEEGQTHRFPHIAERTVEGERYRLSHEIYRRWGPIVGESEVNSAIYEPGDEKFPNEWIGQTISDPVPSLAEAKSPLAYFYRTFGARGEGEPGTEAELAYREAHEYDIEVYQANFPNAVHPADMTTELVPVSEDKEPWKRLQIPPEWVEMFGTEDGVPPIQRQNDGPTSELMEAKKHLKSLSNIGVLSESECELLMARAEDLFS